MTRKTPTPPKLRKWEVKAMPDEPAQIISGYYWEISEERLKFSGPGSSQFSAVFKCWQWFKELPESEEAK